MRNRNNLTTDTEYFRQKDCNGFYTYEIELQFYTRHKNPAVASALECGQQITWANGFLVCAGRRWVQVLPKFYYLFQK